MTTEQAIQHIAKYLPGMQSGDLIGYDSVVAILQSLNEDKSVFLLDALKEIHGIKLGYNERRYEFGFNRAWNIADKAIEKHYTPPKQ